ncbi:HNH endonuclease [Oceanidesulfovibrio marinus]|uniref:HNH endonuclease n=1 Tax=Oceanidesulfovibrio marinus TaxID=370038 RepID=A0ABX6NL11_9BACT|nr:HNH endonuclease [Oceanidesulfovibrio marinus]QJT10901.1 HNH endonuclease [Oceanidesulfovibrio marinus]
MRGNIISYLDMCKREGVSLQRGMNFNANNQYSVILMSVRKNSPYRDEIKENGAVLIYEGHDVPKGKGIDPKVIDQEGEVSSGRLTENGKFHLAAQEYKKNEQTPRIVQVYEKIKQGIWSDNGLFKLVDSWMEFDEIRNVYKFKLRVMEEGTHSHENNTELVQVERSRIIPTQVKLEVWKRDGGKCAVCGATDELHFDHIVPFSKGGTSLKAENIQLLCARHNLQKRDKIQ